MTAHVSLQDIETFQIISDRLAKSFEWIFSRLRYLIRASRPFEALFKGDFCEVIDEGELAEESDEGPA